MLVFGLKINWTARWPTCYSYNLDYEITSVLMFCGILSDENRYVNLIHNISNLCLSYLFYIIYQAKKKKKKIIIIIIYHALGVTLGLKTKEVSRLLF